MFPCSISTMFCTPFPRLDPPEVSVALLQSNQQSNCVVSNEPELHQIDHNYQMLLHQQPSLHSMLGRNIMVARPGLVVVKNAPSINIHTMETEQGRGMIFHPGCPVLRGEQKMKYSSRHPCHHSPLVRQLLNITGVATVTLFPGHVHIEKSDDPPSLDWTSIKPRILATLIHFFSTKLPPTTHHLAKCKHRHKDNGECVTFGYLDDVEAIIDDLINSRIRPTVQDEGGDVIFKDYEADAGTVYVLLLGTCLFNQKATNAVISAALLLLQYHLPCVRDVQQILTSSSPLFQPICVEDDTIAPRR